MESNFQSEMIGEPRQYMVLNKHNWDNKSVNQAMSMRSRDQVLFFHLTLNNKYLFSPCQLKQPSRIP